MPLYLRVMTLGKSTPPIDLRTQQPGTPTTDEVRVVHADIAPSLVTAPMLIPAPSKEQGQPGGTLWLPRQLAPARYRLACVTAGPFADGARECEAEVFTEVYNNTREELAEEYAPYDSQCFVVVIDQELAAADPVASVIASCRIILPGSAGHKSIDDMTLPPWSADALQATASVGINLDHAMDIATIAVRNRGTREGATAMAALCHGMSMVSIAHDIPWLVAILNDTVRRMFKSWQIDLLEIPELGPRPYYGSPASTPVYLNWPAIRAHLRRNAPRRHRTYILGAMDDVVTDPMISFAATTADALSLTG
jgi:hypothetical protein